jgi:methyltransferase (TIGR00027 family)
MDRPVTPAGDAAAQRRLCSGMRTFDLGSLRGGVVARTRFVDSAVLEAVAGGITQVVVCGAGYDDRALRFRTAGVQFFEVDHPATQIDKSRRLRELAAADEVRLLAADFRVDDVAAVLAGGDHDAARPSLFVCEGLLVYLSPSACHDLLAGLRSRADGGSVLAASLAVHRDGIDSSTALAVANARRRTGREEPWRTILPRRTHLELVAAAGWQVEQVVDAADLEPAAEAGRTLLVRASPAASELS